MLQLNLNAKLTRIIKAAEYVFGVKSTCCFRGSLLYKQLHQSHMQFLVNLVVYLIELTTFYVYNVNSSVAIVLIIIL